MANLSDCFSGLCAVWDFCKLCACVVHSNRVVKRSVMKAQYNVRDLGSLVFFGKSHQRITHVGWALDRNLMIEAAGGGSRTHTVKDAERHNAWIRVRPIESRSDLVACIKPAYPEHIDLRLIKDYALMWVMVPYEWGGDDFAGMDCSGFAQEILAAAGIDPKGDQTAQMLYNYFT